MANSVETATWGYAVADLPLNPDSAIYKYWVDQKAQGNLIGIPVTAEWDVGEGNVEQGFSSGLIVGWNADVGIYTR